MYIDIHTYAGGRTQKGARVAALSRGARYNNNKNDNNNNNILYVYNNNSNTYKVIMNSV